MAVLSDASSVLANQPDPSTISAPPAPPAPAVGGGIVNAAQQTAPPSQPTSANPPTNNSPSAQDAHHSLLGRAVKAMTHAIEGNDVSYQPDPESGQVKEVVTPSRPGTFFRRLLAGALIGGAASGAQRSGNFTQGFGSGAEAAASQQQNTDQQRYARAQQQVKDQQEQTRVNDEHTLHQAMVAHTNVEMSSVLHDMWAADEDRVAKLNQANRVYRQALLDEGGVQAKFRVNGQMVNQLPADQFAKLYTSDPTIAHSPDPNQERHFISNTDLSDVHFDGQSWRDDSGNDVSMGPRTTISAIDMPTNSMNSYEPVDGTVLDQLAHGQVVPDPNKKYSINGSGLMAIRNLGLKTAAEETRAAAQRARANRTDQANKQSTQIESKKAAALAKAEHDYWQNINSGKDESNALSQLNAAKQDAQDAYENEIRAAGGSPQHFDYSNGAAPQARPASQPRNNQRNIPRTFSPTKWRAANPNGDVNEALQEAKRQNLQIIQ
jgi:hypothetical protein